MDTVELVEEHGMKRRLTIGRLPATVGRAESADAQVSDALVSRQHCELYEINGTLVVRDLDSRNGTFVDGHRITEAHLTPNSLLTLGMASFRVLYDSGRTKRTSLLSLFFSHQSHDHCRTEAADHSSATSKGTERETLKADEA